MEKVYMVQQGDYSHVDSIWTYPPLAERRKDELNKDATCGGYVVVEVALNKIIENEE